MRVLATVALTTALLTLSPPSSSGQPSARGPFLLVTLPNFGSITWRCDARGTQALGYRASPRFATTDVVLRTQGRIAIRRTVQPGERLRFPFLSASKQTLFFVQAIEPGTLKATVKVDFAAPASVLHCWEYSPPATAVTVWPLR